MPVSTSRIRAVVIVGILATAAREPDKRHGSIPGAVGAESESEARAVAAAEPAPVGEPLRPRRAGRLDLGRRCRASDRQLETEWLEGGPRRRHDGSDLGRKPIEPVTLRG